MQRHYLVTTLLSIGFLALLGACAFREGIPPAIGTSTPIAPLPGLSPWVTGVTWNLWLLTQDDTSPPGTDSSPITLHLESDGSLAGAGGCNSYHGTYAAEGLAIHFRLSSVSDRKCAAPVMAREAAYLQALGRVEEYGWGYSELMLASGDRRTLLAFTGAPRVESPTLTAVPTSSVAAPSPLPSGVLGRTWNLVRLTQDNRDYLHGATVGITLAFFPQHTTIAGRNVCNGYTGLYVASGTSLHLGGHSSTQVRCGEAGELLAWEYFNALRLVERYYLEAGHLVLTSAGGRLQLTFYPLPCTTSGVSGARLDAPMFLSGTPQPLTPTPCPAT